MLQNLPRVRLAHLPTPIEELPRLSRRLGGTRILIKRDDATGLAMGGGMARKLEFLIADALQQGADTLVVAGGADGAAPSQVAAAAARCGLRCVLSLAGRAPEGPPAGNLFLSRLFGASVRWAGEGDPWDMMQRVAEEERSVGRHPYVIPMAGSNPIGALGYVDAMHELAEQLATKEIAVADMLFPTRSGGMHAGLLVGAREVGYAGRLTGVRVGPDTGDLRSSVITVARLTASLIGADLREEPDVAIDDRYYGSADPRVGDAARLAVCMAAAEEGIVLDPASSGRVLAALIDRISGGEYAVGGTVLLWSTASAVDFSWPAAPARRSETRPPFVLDAGLFGS